MIKTIPLDIPTNIWMGSLVALTAWKKANKSEKTLTSKISISAGICGLLFGLGVYYFLAKYPDWMWSYFLDSRETPSFAVAILFIIFVSFSAFSGSVITQLGIKERNWFWAFFPFVFGLILYLFVWGITWDQYFHIGTYAEYYAGKALPLKQSPIQGAMSTIGVLAILPYLAVYIFNIYSSVIKKG